MRIVSPLLSIVALSCAPRNVSAPAAATANAALPAATPATSTWEPPRIDPGRRARFEELVPELEKFLIEDQRKSHAPGMAFALIAGGQTVYAKGFGFRDVAKKLPFTADTPFAIASVSKGFTAMSILKLRDEGKLDLESPAARYYPPLAKLAYPTRDAPPITLRHLLTHGSGMPEDNPWADVTEHLTESDLARLLDRGVMSRAPGIQFEYSNVGYTVLGQVIERLSGVVARDYIRREIFGPLGMRQSGWQPEDFPADTVAVGYRGLEGSRDVDAPSVVAPAEHLGVMETSGGIYTSVRDLGRYVAFQLGAWPPRDDPETGPLKRSSVREMQQGMRSASFYEFTSRLVQRAPPPVARLGAEGLSLDALSYGFGWLSRKTCEADLQVEHSGGLPGYSTFVMMLPAADVGAVLFLNDERARSRAIPGVRKILRRAGLLAPRRVEPAPALAAARVAIDELVSRWEDAKALSVFEPSYFRYQTVETLRERFAGLKRDHGICRPEGDPTFVNRLRGSWREKCERGAITFAAALAPGPRPRIQALELREDLPPSAPLERAGSALLELLARWDSRAASSLFADSSEIAGFEKAFAKLSANDGPCKLDGVAESDGTAWATFILACRERRLELSVAVDKGGRVTSATAHAPRSDTAPNCAE